MVALTAVDTGSNVEEDLQREAWIDENVDGYFYDAMEVLGETWRLTFAYRFTSRRVVEYQVAFCSPRDVFAKAVGRDIAAKRLYDCPVLAVARRRLLPGKKGKRGETRVDLVETFRSSLQAELWVEAAHLEACRLDGSGPSDLCFPETILGHVASGRNTFVRAK